MEIWFSNPVYLWLLAPVPMLIVLMLLSLTKGKIEIQKFISFHSIEFLYKKDGFVIRYVKKNFLIFIFRVLIYIIIVLVIAGITLYYNGTAKEQAVVIAIDASGSMLAEDMQPNRLEAVKETISIFLEKIPKKSTISVLSFSSNAYIEHEQSSKEEVIKDIEKIEISPISGTSIAAALKTAAAILDEEENPKRILLISDGNENIVSDWELKSIAEDLNGKHIILDAIGIGKTNGIKLPGSELSSALNEPLLEDIAKKTGGIYLRAETKQSLAEAYEKIALSTKLKIPIRLASPLVMLCIILLSADYAFVRLI